MSFKSNVFALASRGAGEEAPLENYLLLYSESEITESQKFCLSPAVMCLSEQIILFDLSRCLNYWRMQAEKAQQSLFDFLQTYLQSVFNKNFIAVNSSHPFKALFFLNSLRERGAFGFYLMSSLFSTRYFSHLSWAHWMRSADFMADYFLKHKLELKSLQSYSTHRGRVQRFIHRAHLKSPFEFKSAEATSIRRRFSGFLGMMWAWTYETSNLALDPLNGFPWRPHPLKQKPQRLRELEFPLSEWEPIEALLREDLQTLLELKVLRLGQKLSCLRWEVTMYDFEVEVMDLQFRNPISLEEDAADFKTCLAQAYYAFQALKQNSTRQEDDIEWNKSQLVLSWKLKVQQILNLGQYALEFKSLRSEESQKLDMILQLQNRLPQEIKTCRLQPTHIPVEDYCAEAVSANCLTENIFSPDPMSSKKSIYIRPLYILPQAQPLDAQNILRSRFLERTSADWWVKEDLHDSFRDYFMCELRDKKLIWAYRNYRGDWFQQGVYS